ncbi:MAG TPA: HU family DNA-binding protein, partial [Bryobacteraceae bacterium]|nr:HU family DNA-binding protein [Bryobacteraceae bacterium]
GVRGTLTRDRLALMLQKRGLQFREAQRVVRVIFDSMTRRLRQGERVSVEPLGSFFLKPQPKERRRIRFGHKQTLFRQPTKVAFKPSKALAMILARSATRRAISEQAVKPKDPRYACEKCGSTMFVESEFRQYLQMPSSTPGEDLKSRTEGLPIRVLICLCGHPKRLDRIRRPLKGDLASFEESMAMAMRRRQGADDQVITDKLAAVYAGKARQLALVEQVYWLERMVQALPVSRGCPITAPDAEITGTLSSLTVLRTESRQDKRNDLRLYCDHCGSTMFTEGRFQQWLKRPPLRPGGEEELSIRDTYIEGTVWDRETRVQHLKGIRALACICGHPVRLGRLRRQVPGAQPSFDESFKTAIQTTLCPGVNRQALSEVCPNRHGSRSGREHFGDGKGRLGTPPACEAGEVTAIGRILLWPPRADYPRQDHLQLRPRRKYSHSQAPPRRKSSVRWAISVRDL